MHVSSPMRFLNRLTHVSTGTLRLFTQRPARVLSAQFDSASYHSAGSDSSGHEENRRSFGTQDQRLSKTVAFALAAGLIGNLSNI